MRSRPRIRGCGGRSECDCTGEPPGELITSATARAARMPKARSSGRATVASARPGFSGVEKPMTPESRTTGTTGVSPRSRFGNIGRSVARARGEELPQMLGHVLIGHNVASHSTVRTPPTPRTWFWRGGMSRLRPPARSPQVTFRQLLECLLHHQFGNDSGTSFGNRRWTRIRHQNSPTQERRATAMPGEMMKIYMLMRADQHHRRDVPSRPRAQGAQARLIAGS